MDEYHKIPTLFERDPNTKYRHVIQGKFSRPEFEYLQNNWWIWTEKVDGTNIRVMFDGQIRFSGRTDNAQIPVPLVNALGELFFPLRKEMGHLFPNGVCLYGEGYGAKIQKGGGLYRPDQGFVLFDIKIGEWWLQRNDVVDIARKLGIDVVPKVGLGTLHEMVETVIRGLRSRWGDFIAEGIVARPLVELKGRDGRRIITKIKHKDFPLNGKVIYVDGRPLKTTKMHLSAEDIRALSFIPDDCEVWLCSGDPYCVSGAPIMEDLLVTEPVGVVEGLHFRTQLRATRG